MAQNGAKTSATSQGAPTFTPVSPGPLVVAINHPKRLARKLGALDECWPGQINNAKLVDEPASRPLSLAPRCKIHCSPLSGNGPTF